MQIKPKIGKVVGGLLVTSVFVFFVLLISVYAGDGVFDAGFAARVTVFLMGVTFIVVVPAVFFEYLEIDEGELIHKTVFRRWRIKISEIRRISERFEYRRPRSLQFATDDNSLRVQFKSYSKEEIASFIGELKRINPNISDNFTKVKS